MLRDLLEILSEVFMNRLFRSFIAWFKEQQKLLKISKVQGAIVESVKHAREVQDNFQGSFNVDRVVCVLNDPSVQCALVRKQPRRTAKRKRKRCTLKHLNGHIEAARSKVEGELVVAVPVCSSMF